VPVERFVLPSGARVELGAGDRLFVSGLFEAELRGLSARITEPGGAAVALAELPLADFHVLRAILRRLGVVEEAEVELCCSNCHERWTVKPCSGLELGPFRDDELDDDELDAPFDFARSYELPCLRPGEEAEVSRLRLSPRTLGQAAPLHAAIRADRPLRITSGFVNGLGIDELDGERDARKIARLLARAPDDAFDALVQLFEDAHYPPRLSVPHTCPSCGVSEWVHVPLARELGLEPRAEDEAPAPPDDAQFLSLDAFEELVREEAQAAYRELGLKSIDLLVVEGPAEVDDGGEPLLGCYRPPELDALVPKSAEIRLFYRTFANIQHDEGVYDVRAEVRETLRHELEHHLAHLSGHDPVDDDERDEIEREQVRRVGQAELVRRSTRSALDELRGFVRRTWVLWLIVGLVTLLTLLAESR